VIHPHIVIRDANGNFFSQGGVMVSSFARAFLYSSSLVFFDLRHYYRGCSTYIIREDDKLEKLTETQYLKCMKKIGLSK